MDNQTNECLTLSIMLFVAVASGDSHGSEKDHPDWYNEVTRNCTTTINKQLGADVHSTQPGNYQYLLNGTLDKLLYDRGRLVADGLQFPELKQRQHISDAARAATLSDFS